MIKDIAIWLVLAVVICFQSLGHCEAATTTGPFSLYCQKLQSKFTTLCKAKAVPSETVTIEFCIDGSGLIKQAQVSKDSEGSMLNKNNAKLLVQHLGRIAPPPHGAPIPLWLSVDLSPTPQSITVCFRDLDFAPYMSALQSRVRSTATYDLEHGVLDNWRPPNGNKQLRTIVAFKVFGDGAIKDLTIYKSCGEFAVDQAALKAVQRSAPFSPLPDGVAGYVNVNFTVTSNIFNGSVKKIF